MEMTEARPVTVQEGREIKLYSMKMINLAAFLGGPLAGGWLIRSNLLALGKDKQALYATLIAIGLAAAIISTIYFVPEDIIDPVPDVVFPSIYMAVLAFVAHTFMGIDFKQHTERNGLYHSNWRVAGISLIAFVFFAGTLFGLLFVKEIGFNADEYNTYIDKFSKNEAKALRLYEDDMSPRTVIAFLEVTGIPKWQENIELLKAARALPEVPEDVLAINQELEKYCSLRLETYQLHHKALKENTEIYNDRIQALHAAVDEIVAKLQ